MTEREELELAAKAAGIEYEQYVEGLGLRWWIGDEQTYDGIWADWNPRTNDADAFRLGVKIGAFNGWPSFSTYRTAYELDGHDALTATRLAIFRLAVEIGGKV